MTSLTGSAISVPNRSRRYCSPLKMTPLTAETYKAKTGKKRGVRAHNRRVRETVKEQHQYASQIIWAARSRIEQRQSRGLPIDMFTVWNDFDPDTGKHYPTKKRYFPQWRDLSEYLKYHVAGLCVLATKGYTFSARLNPDLERRWLQNGYDFYERIKKRIAKEFREAGLSDVGYAFVVEGKNRKGSRTGLHIHGVFFFNDGLWYRDKVRRAIEAALKVGDFRQGVRRSRDVHVTLMYDPAIRGDKPPARWAAYTTKNSLKPDDRLPHRRIFMNQMMTQMAREMWGQIRGVPIGKE